MQTIPISIQQGGQSIPLSVSGGGTNMDLTPEQLRVVEAVSPTVVAERVEGGVEITVHDLRGTQTVELRDGERGETGEAGPQGVPGVSPMATVTQTATGAIITITDAYGTTTVEVKNGQKGDPGSPGDPGADGVSPTITVTDITGGHRVTITDATGPHTFDVINGAPGRGITSAVLNADYTLSLTFTDGTTYVTPSIRGEPGPAYELTDEDKQDIIDAVLAVYPAAEGVSF